MISALSTATQTSGVAAGMIFRHISSRASWSGPAGNALGTGVTRG